MKLESWGQVAASSQTISVQVSDTRMRLKVEKLTEKEMKHS